MRLYGWTRVSYIQPVSFSPTTFSSTRKRRRKGKGLGDNGHQGEISTVVATKKGREKKASIIHRGGTRSKKETRRGKARRRPRGPGIKAGEQKSVSAELHAGAREGGGEKDSVRQAP